MKFGSAKYQLNQLNQFESFEKNTALKKAMLSRAHPFSGCLISVDDVYDARLPDFLLSSSNFSRAVSISRARSQADSVSLE